MKIYTILLLLILSGKIVSGQCVPDPNITVPGIYPDSATGLPHAIVGQAYSTVIQTRVLTDSTVGIFHAIIDSIVINNVTGLPTGFSYSCTPSNCSFPGGSNGCILLQGSAPTTPMVGIYPIVVMTTIYFNISGTPQTTTDNNSDYSIIIDDNTGIPAVGNSSFSIGQNMPNPVRDMAVIPVVLNHSAVVSFTLSNVIGKKIMSKSYNLERGRTNIQIDLHGIQPGIYLYSFSNGATTLTRRMIISND